MRKLITLAIPIYKRLTFLPQILASVERQQCADLEVIISDNGGNGNQVEEIVRENFHGLYHVRHRPRELHIDDHFNCLVQEASGEYFLLLCDDDQITDNYLLELSRIVDRNPHVPLALSRQEVINERGECRSTSIDLPELISGSEFIKHRADYRRSGFRNTVTHLARTVLLRRCGGWPVYPRSYYSDEALLMKLTINGTLGFSAKCAFRHRIYQESYGLTGDFRELARASRMFLTFLADDPHMKELTLRNPREYREVRGALKHMVWSVYLTTWKSRYRLKLRYGQWLRAAFAMPVIPSYYARVAAPLARTSLTVVAHKLLKRGEARRRDEPASASR